MTEKDLYELECLRQERISMLRCKIARDLSDSLQKNAKRQKLETIATTTALILLSGSMIAGILAMMLTLGEII